MARGASTFGLSSSRARGSFRPAGYRGRGRGRGRGGAANSTRDAPRREDDGTQLAERFERIKVNDEVDEKLGFAAIQEGGMREGWLVNMHPTLVKDADWPSGKAAVDYYFIQDDGSLFKTTYVYEPYFHIACKSGMESSIEEYLNRKYEGLICRIVRERKEDLKLPNHLMGHRRLYLQLSFRNVTDLLTVRRDLMPLALTNSAKRDAVDAYAEVVNATSSGRPNVNIDIEEEADWTASSGRPLESREDPREGIIDIREYDVPYYLRVAIDNDIRVGLWYAVTFTAGQPSFRHLTERVKRADPVVMAYDIETTKAPLKFPDQAIDQVMMISYMVDGQGYLITNREIVSEDIEDFEYTPKEGYEGPFIVFNEADEVATIKRFFSHIRDVKPTVMATFNGDFFDFPFLDARSKANGIDMFLETGFAKDSEDEYKSRTCVHMDCFRWVKRDSYLPQGSQGLKAVTTAKLGYNPIELDPELMTPYAMEQPQTLAQYSVSDAVATYYLYMKYVHPFIFSLCNIIPLNPDEVLRKGSGTLCETLLMVEAYRATIIMPNRHEEEHGNFYEGHLLASETYVGGHVEALEAGVFRSDIPTDFKIVPSAVQQLIDDLDAALMFCIVEESKASMESVTNYDEVKSEIQAALEVMRDNPRRVDNPLIYHLDVAAMYPNIMLSNRLQPDSMVDEAVCAVCDFNRPGKTCDRRLDWAWRGEFFPAHRDEYNMIRHALNQETFPPRRPGGPQRRYTDLSPAEQTALLHKRLGDYSRKVYKKTKDTKVETRQSIVCQRENPFYVDTVRRFRDRRYEYKGLHKTWKKNLDNVVSEGRSIAEIDEAKKMIVLYDSLQLAHKCILNSFYGYVMRKGARWHSMEMAGITCLTGATIIQMARALVEQIGRPLELDTDGIWCMLPGVFPENFKFKLNNGKSIGFSYPCTMLNHLVHAQFTNHQYHDLDLETGQYKIHSENSIFFELDGPYKAMILPSSKEEDKLLKKRYAVFNDDGSMAELKGFEVKRRGELQLIKIFQSQLFEKFLLGSTLEECYSAVAQVADQWLDVLYSRAASLEDEELVELIAENRSMSKTLAEYGGQKSTSISTARRLAEFLGNQMVKDKGLACKFIISARPIGAPVTERAVPVAIFSAEESVKRTYLRKWLKDSSLVDFDLRSILDWEYYIERLGSVIQKLITIPAAMQKVSNPVPRIHHPDWLHRRVAGAVDKFKQNKLTDFFKPVDGESQSQRDSETQIADIEDTAGEHASKRIRIAPLKPQFTRQATPEPEGDSDLSKPLPDPYMNYSAWIKAMRPRWKRRREGADSSSTVVPSMFSNVKVRTDRRWDIVQIRATSTPGRYMLWLSIDSDLVSVPLRIPREFYVHLRSPKEDVFREDLYSYEKVTRHLPRDSPCVNLYKVTVREDLYQENSEHFIDLTNDPNVDGVFELQVPLVVRGLLKLGKRCENQDSAMSLNRAQTIGFDLHQLDTPLSSSTKRKYMNSGVNKKYIFLYHACSANAPVHVFAVFFPTGVARLHLVDPATRRQPIRKGEQFYGKSNSFSYPEAREFTITYHSSDLTALKAISRELGLQEDKSFTIIISSSKDDSYYDARLPKLQKFPVLYMSKAKTAHTLDTFPWQSHVAHKMISRYLSVGSWLDRLIALADYYDIPIGHIEGDQPLCLSDLSFARRLVQQDMVLWWSPSELPDLGGIENDKPPIEELPSSEFVVPGAYSNVCLEVAVRNLAINSVVHSVAVNELEGSGGSTAFDSVSRTIDAYAQGDGQRDLTLGQSSMSSQTFGIMKTMVKGWLLDRITSEANQQESPATVAMDHFWRWTSSTVSNLYDPSIHRFIHGLMRKTFIQLLAEFKRLGSQVIYADFSRILLSTSKPPGTAYAYATYVNTAITSHELFEHLSLRTERFYDYMLFMDQANMGGIVCEDPLALEPPTELSLEMRWNIVEFLPKPMQKDFSDMVQYLIVSLFKVRQKANESGRVPLRALQNGAPDATQHDQKSKDEMEHVKEFIARKLTRKLLKTVGHLQEQHRDAMMHEESAKDFDFPVLPGSHLHMSNPLLEFIKFLASEYHVEIGLLKRNALDLIGVKEFANEAIFRNPCEPLKLPSVPCKHCDALRDFDFCRDPDLLPSNSDVSPKWTCNHCHGEYDRVAIEFTLIGFVYGIERAYAQQDLKCSKCQQIQSDNVSRYCQCSGSYQLTVNKADMRRKLRTMVNVAIVHGFVRLKTVSSSRSCYNLSKVLVSMLRMLKTKLQALPIRSTLPQALNSDPPTISAFLSSLKENPSRLRRARLAPTDAHFSYVTPLPLPFPYQIELPEDDPKYVEQWLAEREPLSKVAENLYSSEKRKQPAILIGLAETCLRDCLPHLDVGDAFTSLGTPTLLDVEEEEYTSSNPARQDLIDILSGQSVIISEEHNFAPWSLRYSGHQFGSWAGQLGDGRAVTVLVTPHPSVPDLSYELQLKGAGRTPYSRTADGLAVARSSIREFLASEAMQALGIPTTRSLALISLPEIPVMREKMEYACVTTRVAPSFLRIGSFEALNGPTNMMFFGGGQQKPDWDALLKLAEYVSKDVLKLESFGKGEKWAKDLVYEVAKRNAKMVAGWQAYGFMHGVINTDNVSVLGLTIDYGPYAFMDVFDPFHICNHTDEGGSIYALRALLNSLAPLIGAESSGVKLVAGWASSASQEQLDEWSKLGVKETNEEMERLIQETMSVEYGRLLRKRLGFHQAKTNDETQFFQPLLNMMQNQKLDFHRTFRLIAQFSLADFKDSEKKNQFIDRILSNVSEPQMVDNFSATKEWDGWLEKYAQRLQEEGVDEEERIREAKGANPRFVLRQWLLEEVIKKVENDESKGRKVLAKVLHLACNPYEDWGGEETEGKVGDDISDDELKEERRYCGVGDRKMLGFQCSCSS
ncbi:hypothetical protein D9758_003792 [Tetrapyrgos nigripes]|uniref:DNA polymerase epsilon catalytic subunit A n=1 Tax=Tetrapyrgos nigripes TaxID=182062 RepID=A0A8H5GMN2_9AGAR|nr:hypothetical protein D9758_003792 [Tetrapyrgos nigripes]